MKKLKLLLLGLLLLSFSNAMAQSFYSSRGVGIVRYFVSGRGVGMGGVGLSISGPLTVNYINPAAIVAHPLTTITGNFFHESVSLNGTALDGSISDTNVGGFQFVVPIQRNFLAIALGLVPYTSIEYAFVSQGTFKGVPFNERISGDGGVNIGFFSFAFKPIERLYVGAMGMLYFGNLRNFWRVDFETREFVDIRDEVKRGFTAGGIRGGFILHLSKRWSVAGVYSPSVNLNVNRSIRLRFGEVDNFGENKDIDLPKAYGFGTSFMLGKLLAAADVYFEKWSEVENSNGFVNDSKRIAFGVEYSGRGSFEASYFSRVALRAGIYYRDLGLEEPAGAKVTELFGTFGLGLPIKWRASRLDFAIEAGRRGSLSSNPIKETVVRITGTITIGERWFYRGGRINR